MMCYIIFNRKKGGNFMLDKKVGGRPSKRPDLDELAKLYCIMSATEIAKKYNVPVATVRSWIYRARQMERESE